LRIVKNIFPELFELRELGQVLEQTYQIAANRDALSPTFAQNLNAKFALALSKLVQRNCLRVVGDDAQVSVNCLSQEFSVGIDP
jgi:hypothetical protein